MISNLPYFIILGIGLIVSLAFCIKRSKGFGVSNLLFKAVSSLCFILSGVFALIVNSNALIYGTLVIFGGILGLVGDISLDLKGIYKKDEKSYLNAGFIFFLVGHIFYIIAIALTSQLKLAIIGICAIAALLFSIGNLFVSKIMKLNFGEFRNIVTLYVFFLAFTMLLSIAACITSHFELKYILLSAGAIAFTLSDVVLSSTYFGEGKDTGFYYFINHFLYYAGQYLIASSILFM